MSIPKYSQEDRYKIVMNFIARRGEGQIPIADFTPLIRYFDDIRPLRNIKKTGSYPVFDLNNLSTTSPVFPNTRGQLKPNRYDPCVCKEDAEEYFNWLMITLTADDKATEETRNEAVNQLFLFIFVLRDKFNVNLDNFLKGGFVWQERMNIIDENITDLMNKLEYFEKSNDSDHYDFTKSINEVKKDHETMTSVLERIGNWEKDFQPRVEKLEKAQKRTNQIFKGKPIAPKGNSK